MSKDISVFNQNKPAYDITIRNDFLDLPLQIKKLSQKQYRRVCLVSDTNVSALYLEEVSVQLAPLFDVVTSFVFQSGEASKNLTTVEKLYEKLISKKFDRHDLLIALGGGVVGDLTGFAAATFLRGIDFIQVPTSLLAFVDSSIGGKTGVDFHSFKNMVGAFYMPQLVYMNISVLKSLPKEQISSGMAEIIKHGLILNADYYIWLKRHYTEINQLDEHAIEEMIYESCLIKKNIVEKDPTEKGIRAYLNFGHTIGHAVEKLSDFSLFHGQCVSIGIVSAAYLSMKKGYLSETDYQDIRQTLSLFHLPLCSKLKDNEAILVTTKSDKKMVGNKIRFILLDGIGNAMATTDLTDDELLDGIRQIVMK